MVITPANVASLQVAWHFTPLRSTMTGQPGPKLYATPAVDGTSLYLGSDNGWFYSLNRSNGHIRWKRFFGYTAQNTCRPRGIISSAALANDPSTGKEMVYVYAPDGYLYALDASDGTEAWRSLVMAPGNDEYYSWSSPTVWNGRIYVGMSSHCDVPLTPGGLRQFDQATGQLLHTYWSVTEPRQNGGGIWSTAGVSSGGSLVVTTGTGCLGCGDSLSIVRLNSDTLAKEDVFTVPPEFFGQDSDFGASPTFFTASLGAIGKTPMVGACNKNGLFYALKTKNFSIGPVWTYRVAHASSEGGNACLAAAVWNGSRLFVSGPDTTIGGADYLGSVTALNPSTGAPIWQRPLNAGVSGTPTLNGNGILAAATYDFTVGAENGVYLLNASDGTVLRRLGDAPEFAQPVFAGPYVFVTTLTHGIDAYKPVTP
jgi:outer membrane protein assembly factor BamB